MSGGHFNYNQHFINDIADEIEELIEKNKVKPEYWSEITWEQSNHQVYQMDIIKEFKKAVKILRKAYVYAHRIDWLLSGDDSEDYFLQRLREELKKC